MTHLRKMMLDELQRRNYAETTINSYIRIVEDFSQRFQRRPDRLGPQQIREYQAELFKKRKLAASTVTVYLAALRFFYTKTLKRGWSVAETPYPKRAEHVPVDPEPGRSGATDRCGSHSFPSHAADDALRYRSATRRVDPPENFGRRQPAHGVHVQGGKGRKDRDVMLSPKLLMELREHWRRLRRKPSEWLFPGNRTIPVISRSLRKWSGMHAGMPPSERASKNGCTRIP